MNNQEAKFILGGYRPNGKDAQDEKFCEALKQAQRDPALGAWFAREQAHDRAMAAKLLQIAPPAGLREAILAGARVSGNQRAIWRQPIWLAMAAAAAVLLAVTAALWPKRTAAVSGPLVNFAMADAADASKHGGHGAAEVTLQTELSNSSTHLTKGLPMDFTTLENTGCRTLDVAGQPVLEVCFQRDGAWFHCYIARCDDFPSLSAKQEPLFAENGKVSAVTWADGAHRFVVAGVAARDAIERLL